MEANNKLSHSFLQNETGKCDLKESYNVSNVKAEKWKHHGFDYTGKFYTIMDGPTSSGNDTRTSPIIVLTHDEVIGEIKRRSIILESKKHFITKDSLVYDPFTTHWFHIIYPPISFDKERTVTINCGNFTSIIQKISPDDDHSEVISTVNIDEVESDNNTVQLTFPNSPGDLIYSTLKKDEKEGNILFLVHKMINGDLIIDLITVNNKNAMTLYKHVCLKRAECRKMCTYKSFGYKWHLGINLDLFLDIQLERIYLVSDGEREIYYPRGKVGLNCFDFSGKLMFTYNVQGNSGKSYRYLTQLRQSTFLVISEEMIAKIMTVTPEGLELIREFQSPTSNLPREFHAEF